MNKQLIEAHLDVLQQMAGDDASLLKWQHQNREYVCFSDEAAGAAAHIFRLIYSQMWGNRVTAQAFEVLPDLDLLYLLKKSDPVSEKRLFDAGVAWTQLWDKQAKTFDRLFFQMESLVECLHKNPRDEWLWGDFDWQERSTINMLFDTIAKRMPKDAVWAEACSEAASLSDLVWQCKTALQVLLHGMRLQRGEYREPCASVLLAHIHGNLSLLHDLMNKTALLREKFQTQNRYSNMAENVWDVSYTQELFQRQTGNAFQRFDDKLTAFVKAVEANKFILSAHLKPARKTVDMPASLDGMGFWTTAQKGQACSYDDDWQQACAVRGFDAQSLRIGREEFCRAAADNLSAFYKRFNEQETDTVFRTLVDAGIAGYVVVLLLEKSSQNDTHVFDFIKNMLHKQHLCPSKPLKPATIGSLWKAAALSWQVVQQGGAVADSLCRFWRFYSLDKVDLGAATSKDLRKVGDFIDAGAQLSAFLPPENMPAAALEDLGEAFDAFWYQSLSAQRTPLLRLMLLKGVFARPDAFARILPDTVGLLEK